jgi:hypothetical protein
MGLTLREVRDEDLPLLFEQWADPVAVHMAAFTAPDHMDWDAFERRWSRLRADETVLARVLSRPLPVAHVLLRLVVLVPADLAGAHAMPARHRAEPAGSCR